MVNFPKISYLHGKISKNSLIFVVDFPKMGNLHGKLSKNGLFAWYCYQKIIVSMGNF
jgi:hypothetical protein